MAKAKKSVKASDKLKQTGLKQKLQAVAKQLAMLKKEGKAQIVKMKAEFASKLAAVESEAYEKGATDALKEIESKMDAKIKVLEAAEKKFEKEYEAKMKKTKKVVKKASKKPAIVKDASAKKSTKSAKSTKSVKTAKPAKAVKPAKTAKSTKATKSAISASKRRGRPSKDHKGDVANEQNFAPALTTEEIL